VPPTSLTQPTYTVLYHGTQSTCPAAPQVRELLSEAAEGLPPGDVLAPARLLCLHACGSPLSEYSLRLGGYPALRSLALQRARLRALPPVRGAACSALAALPVLPGQWRQRPDICTGAFGQVGSLAESLHACKAVFAEIVAAGDAKCHMLLVSSARGCLLGRAKRHRDQPPHHRRMSKARRAACMGGQELHAALSHPSACHQGTGLLPGDVDD